MGRGGSKNRGGKKAGFNKPAYRKKPKEKKPAYEMKVTRIEPSVTELSGDLTHNILAAYYNDARRNIHLCLNDISLKMGFREEENESRILEMLNRFNLSGATPEKRDELIEHFRYRFGFLNVLTDNPPPVPPKKDNFRNLSAEELAEVNRKHGEALKNHQEKKKRWKENLLPLPVYYERHLIWMLSLIRDLRNSTTHPTEPEETISFMTHRRLYHALRKVYESSFHTVKKRFGHTTELMEPFKRCGDGGIVKLPADFDFCLCADPKSREDKELDLPQSQVIYDFGHVLFCSLFLEKQQSAELISRFWELPAKESDRKKGKLTFGDNWTTEEKTIIREMVAVFRVRLPLQRLKSDDTPVTVTMDTLSELSRCPRPLLDMLSPDDKNKFRGNPGADGNSDNSDSPDNDSEDAVAEEGTYLFARSHNDRFTSLMMRFFDFNQQNRIRFAIDLGQFYYNVRLKPAHSFADHQPRVRRLSQKILGYGYLLDYEAVDKPQDWLQLEENYQSSKEEENALLENAGQSIEPLKPYIVQTYPHYHYFGDKIGFRIAPPNAGKAAYPNLGAGVKAAEKGPLNCPRAEEMQPEYWMSREQLLHLAFYSFLEQKVTHTAYPPLHDVLLVFRRGISGLFQTLRDKPEDIQGELSGEPHSDERKQSIQNVINKRVQAAADSIIRDKGQREKVVRLEIPYTALPKVIIRHLSGAEGRQVAMSEVVERAKRLLEQTELRQQRLKDQLQMVKKRGQKGFRAVKCGPIGDFMAEDLMRFQPVDGNKPDGGKINSQQYQILQKTLAYYGAHTIGKNLPEIVALLRDADLLSGPFAHPFIGKLNLESQPDRFKGLIDFYEAYLQARATYLKQWIKEHEGREQLNHLPQWLRMRKPSTLDSWMDEQLKASSGLKHPLPLAKNMLYGLILRMVSDVLGISPQQLEQEGGQTFRNNKGETVVLKPAVTWLVKRYLQAQGDSAQAMYYEYERTHALFNTWDDPRGRGQMFTEKPQRYFSGNERMAKLDTVRDFVSRYCPDNNDDLERIHHQLANARQPTPFKESSNTVKAVRLRGLIKGYKRDEQRVRYSVSQDMLLFLAASNHLDSLQLSHSQDAVNWRLSHIETSLLKNKIDYRLEVPETGRVLEHKECKIRDRGKLSLLVRDRRVKRLVAYYPENEVLDQAEIRSELRAYARAKVDIMGKVHELEKRIVWGLGNVELRTDEERAAGKKYFGKARHGDYLYKLYQHVAEASPDKSTDFTLRHFQSALSIRNAFSHNQYPTVKDFPHIAELMKTEQIPVNSTIHRKVAERMLDELERIYQPWIVYLKERVGNVAN